MTFKQKKKLFYSEIQSSFFCVTLAASLSVCKASSGDLQILDFIA